MNREIRIWEVIAIIVILFSTAGVVSAENQTDTTVYTSKSRFVHRLGVDLRPEYIIPATSFLKGENEKMRPVRNSFSAHLKYSFQPRQDSYIDKIFRGSYQGVGLAYYTFGEKKTLGNPVALYIFQGSRLARISNRLSLNYEWNFGLSAGWHPHDYDKNPYNTIIGSKVNAYINADLYFNWMLSRKFDLTTGLALTHFSNGNTSFPNAGLNSIGFKAGLIYNFNRENDFFAKKTQWNGIHEFPRHISYDLVLFGSWRRKGIAVGEDRIPSPHSYPVMGINFAPMYNTGYRFRVGASLDGYYDSSINIYTTDEFTHPGMTFFKPPLKEQLALGISARSEYVMPYFSVNIGLGVNIINHSKILSNTQNYNPRSVKNDDSTYEEIIKAQNQGEKKLFYQIIALKINATRNSFIHIGYSLQNFDTPNFLMLGIGIRFNNKYPSLKN